ncbi:MAG: sulfotransferase family 2 domain-containing protein [Flavobacteriales bacterium]
MKPVIFFHIPKTAGTSFHDILGSLYSPERTFSVSGLHAWEKLQELKALPEKDLQRLELIKGHLVLTGDEILGKGCIFLSFFREPIQRTISAYHYIRRAPHNHYHEVVKKLHLRDFGDFLLDKKRDNLQTRSLVTPPEKILFPEEREPLSELKGYGSERAISVVHQKIDHPLITEEFDRGLLYLARVLGWSHVPTPEVRNASRSKDKKRIGRKTLAELEKVNELDLELYEKAKALFYSNLEEVWNERMEKELLDLQKRKSIATGSSRGLLERLKRKLWS